MNQQQPVASIPGADLYPMGPYMDPSLPVYKPQIARGLLSDSQADDMIQDFAGGLLNGYQVRPAQGDLTQYGLRAQGSFSPNGGLLGSPMTATDMGIPQAPMNPQAPMPTMVTPVNPSGVYSATPNPEAGTTAPNMFGDMTTGDLARMFLSREMGADPTALGGQQAVRAQMAQNILGGTHGLYQRGESFPQAQRILGVDLGQPASMSDAQKVMDWVNRQSASQGSGDGGR